MKKIVVILLCVMSVLLISTSAFADVDLSGMSYDELVALKDQINLAIWNSNEWQEVEVPQGVWEIGADIPAGKWTIKAASGVWAYVKVGTETKDGGTDVSKVHADEFVYAEDNKLYNPNSNLTEWSIELVDGEFIKISSGIVIFTPYAGKPSLGFK